MIALVVFAEMKKENKILGSYILQLITEGDHYIGSGNEGIQKFRGIGIGRFLVQMVKFYTYGVSKETRYDVVLKTSMIRRENYFTHIGFQRMKMEDDIRDLLFSFNKECKCIMQGKDIFYHLYHLKKIKHVEVVDTGTIKQLQDNQIMFYRSDDNIKCDMWKVFNNKKSYMSISSSDQEVGCCLIYIGTAFHDLLNDHYDHIHKDNVCMLCPSVDQFMLKVQKKQESSSRKKKDH